MNFPIGRQLARIAMQGIGTILSLLFCYIATLSVVGEPTYAYSKTKFFITILCDVVFYAVGLLTFGNTLKLVDDHYPLYDPKKYWVKAGKYVRYVCL